MEFTRATVKDTDLLAELEIRSESHWGYDAAFMENFKKHYLITEEFINRHPTWIFWVDDTAAGFYGLKYGETENFLEFLFTEPQFIGKGYGKMLWNHALNECRKAGIRDFIIITSPEARGFYLHMGAEMYDEVDSLVSEGHKTPRMIFRL